MYGMYGMYGTIAQIGLGICLGTYGAFGGEGFAVANEVQNPVPLDDRT